MLSCYRTNFVALAVARSTISVEGARVQFVIFFQPSNFVWNQIISLMITNMNSKLNFNGDW